MNLTAGIIGHKVIFTLNNFVMWLGIERRKDPEAYSDRHSTIKLGHHTLQAARQVRVKQDFENIEMLRADTKPGYRNV
ncbi:MAG: hypothetical protein C4B58_12495 [Deltaproteobacteria bacterium]|nr:MAG: hypothetical protein C4B58_12495 [Deltaproteobacteria bacterium]